MKNLLVILSAILFCTNGFAQVTQDWVQRYNGPGNAADDALAVAVDNEGNVYVTGRTTIFDQFTNFDYGTIKYNSDGAEQWVQLYNGPVGYGGDQANAIAVDNQGNIFVTGSSYGGSDFGSDYATIKYNTNGAEQWVQRYNGSANVDDEAKAITLDNDGNVYVTGYSIGIPNNVDYATIKYNSAGVEKWVQSYDGGYGNEGASAITVDNQGNIYVTGTSMGSGSNNDIATIKYNSSGAEQWIQRYNGGGATAIAVDNEGNVFVTGVHVGSGSGADYVTIKYDNAGVERWDQIYNGPGNGSDQAIANAVDNKGNVYVTGLSIGGSTYDCATIKYDPDGIEQWVQRYDGGNTQDRANSIKVDNDGNVYIAGFSNANYLTIKYDSDGIEEWVQSYDGPAGLGDGASSIAIDSDGDVYVTGSSVGNGSNLDYATIKYSKLTITNPIAGEKWIAGETDTIKWTGNQSGQLLDLEYSTDNGNTYSIIKLGVLADSGSYAWKVPKNLLSTKVKIKLTDVADTLLSIASGKFKIKPYLLTRMSSTEDYDAYSKFRDPYSFGNDSISVWPIEFWQNFDYTGTDPFTGFNYLVGVPVWLLLQTSNSDHPDWVSWVRTFGVSACYYNTSFPPVYSRTALVKWIDYSDEWGGSCFGISTSNVLLFNNTTAFLNYYQSFPTSDPILIQPTDSVRTVINELFTHQFGSEHLTYRRTIGLLKTPNQTLREIRTMLLDDDPLIRTLSIVSNDPTDPGGHSIMAYKVEQDTTLSNIFYVFTYDNAYPNNLDSAIIVVDTLANGNNGTWSPNYGWQNWGGTKWFYLRDPAISYFVNPSLPKNQSAASPFILGENELQILNTRTASIKITDQQGNSSGYMNGVLLSGIPGSIPNIIENGSSGPPIGYDLQTANYSVQMSNYQNQRASISFYIANKSFKIYRDDAQLSENDRLFFDGGVSVVNPDAQNKTISLLNLINETTQEKLAVVSSLELAQNDSVKIENPDSNKVKLISYGSAKDYDIDLNYSTENGIGRFANSGVTLTANTSHTFLPDWINLSNSQLVVLVDVGNNGTIDDTLHLNNTVGVEDQGSLLSPNSYSLAQNYPNPFNPVTTIQYSIPRRSNVVLKVYDVLGNEVTTLVNEEKERGVYSINFDAAGLASGLYLYRLQAGSFIETKKMILIK